MKQNILEIDVSHEPGCVTFSGKEHPLFASTLVIPTNRLLLRPSQIFAKSSFVIDWKKKKNFRKSKFNWKNYKNKN